MPLGLLAALRFVWLNRGYRGLWLVAVGAGLNLAVMAANGGLMPVAPAALRGLGDARGHQVGAPLAASKDRALPDSVARLAVLDDRLVYQLSGLRVACSIGDLVVLAGCLVTLREGLLGEDHLRPRPSTGVALGQTGAGGRTPGDWHVG